MLSVKCEMNVIMICTFSFCGEGLKSAANTDTVTHLMEQNAGDADSC